MPTIFTHAITGLAAGKLSFFKDMPARFWIFSIICPMIPDFDVVLSRFGVPFKSFYAHRGFFHSLTFALIVALIVAFIFFKKQGYFSRRWNSLTLYFFIITALHPLMDMLTNGGPGIALFSPFTDARFFFPWRPIPVSPLGIRSFFSEWGLNTMVFEILWIWLPLGALVAAVLLVHRFMKKRV
ncbi:MAG: metal-dependent hydrolase [candidate division Zixibacteria bacterium]|nr:metal-dependent hydrolase [candidate division Zixibacteria bacterium]